MLTEAITILLMIIGVVLVTAGAGMIYTPLAFLVPGVVMLWAGRNLAITVGKEPA